MAYITGNPLPSTNPKDLSDNAEIFDGYINSASPAVRDRFNRRRETWSGLIKLVKDFLASMGFEATHLTYIDGTPLTVLRPTQLIDRGSFSYAVKQPATFPVSLSGSWATDALLLVDTTTNTLQSALASSTGSSMIGHLGRTLLARLNDLPSILDAPWSAPTGEVDASPAFQAAVNSVPAGESATFLVPASPYLLLTDVVPNGRNVTFLCMAGAVFTGAGFLETNVVSYDANGGVYGKSRHAFGSNMYGGGGVLIGGGAMDEGHQGTYLANDGHANWLRAQTSINYNPTELVIYGAPGQGRAVSVVGGGFIDRTEGTVFDPAWVDRPFYFLGTTFLVDSFVSTDRLKLKNLNGTAVMFASANFAAFHYVRTTGVGLCKIVGNVVTRLSGQPFIPLVTYPGFEFRIGGAPTTVASWQSGDQMTLATSPGDQASIAYGYEIDINAQISTIRVQKTFGTTEENLTISAKATGEFEFRVGVAGSGDYYPLRVYNGASGPFAPKPLATFSPNGNTGFSNAQNFTPSALLEVSSNRTETISAGVYNEAVRIGTVWAGIDNRALEFGCFANGTQGGYVQGRDTAGSAYDVSLNPRGGNVGVGTNAPVMRLTVAGVIGPAADNLYSLGQSGARFTSVWAVNGTIQTSDETLKTDIQDSPLGLEFIRALRPISYRFKIGGQEVTEIEDGFDEVTEFVYEEVASFSETKRIEVIGGKKRLVSDFTPITERRQVFDTVTDVFDSEGNPLGPIKIPRTQVVRTPRTRQVVKDVPGIRTHYGFPAGAVQEAAKQFGVDFGGFVLAEDGTKALRYDQFIAPLAKAVVQVDDRLAALAEMVASMQNEIRQLKNA